jgi:hypothetical protein
LGAWYPVLAETLNRWFSGSDEQIEGAVLHVSHALLGLFHDYLVGADSERAMIRESRSDSTVRFCVASMDRVLAPRNL